MGVSFFITAREDIDPGYLGPDEQFRLKPQEFAEALNAKWKNTNVSIDNSEHFALRWECEVNLQYGLMGSLFRDSCGVVLEKPSLEDVADFAIWFRSIVPLDVQLAVYNSSNITPFDLTVHTTYLQIIDFFTHYDYVCSLALSVTNGHTFDLSQLETNLKQSWPDVNIFTIGKNDPYSFYWEVKQSIKLKHHTPLSKEEVFTQEWEQQIIQSGAVNPERTVIYFSCYPYPELAKVLLWFRNTLPKSDGLLAERKIDARQMMIVANTTAEEIIETFTQDWERE
ncbi:MAG: hypothetical protein R3E39_09145 [Anaerolineae bacterium]